MNLKKPHLVKLTMTDGERKGPVDYLQPFSKEWHVERHTRQPKTLLNKFCIQITAQVENSITERQLCNTAEKASH